MGVQGLGESFIVAGGTGIYNISYSYSGVGWSGATGLPGGFTGSTNLFGTCNTIVWNGAMWLVGASGINQIGYSSDGINWTAAPTDVFSGGSCNALAWNGSLWVGGGTSSTTQLAYSSAGVTGWTGSASTVFSGGQCSTVAWNGSIWLAGGSATNTLAFSYNGITWTEVTFTGFTSCNAIATSGPLWVAGGTVSTTGSCIQYSLTGISEWTPAVSAILTQCNCIAWNGIMWVAGGLGPTTIVHSSDGSTWTAAESGAFTDQCNAIAWNGAMWLAAGTGIVTTTILISYDGGINWNPPSVGGNLISLQCNTLAARRVLPYIGLIVGQPYLPAVFGDWPNSIIPTLIPQALDMIAACLRYNINNNILAPESWA
jgi:hypothetical protein